MPSGANVALYDEASTDDWGSLLLDRHRPIGRFIVPVLLGLALGSLIVNLRLLLQSLEGNALFEGKDIIQEWLLAKSILTGTDPYQPTEVLARHFLGPISHVQNGEHPTPHPPTAGLLFLPMGALDYRVAVYVWFAVEVACLFGAVYVLCRTFAVPRSARVAISLLPVALAWGAVSDDLMLGQLVIVQLFLLALGGFFTERRKSARAGIVVGLAILLKPMVWPVACYFLVRRDLRALSSLAVTLGTGCLASFAVLGPATLIRYAVDVLPYVDRIYAASLWNLSLRTVGPRLFAGTYSPIQSAITAPPLFSAPRLAGPVGLLLPLVVIVVAVIASRRAEMMASYGSLICASVVSSPVAWGPYLLLLAIPIAWLVHRLSYERPSLPIGVAGVATSLILYPRWSTWVDVAGLLAGASPTPVHAVVLPPGIAMVTLLPTFVVLALMGFVISLARVDVKRSAYRR